LVVRGTRQDWHHDRPCLGRLAGSPKFISGTEVGYAITSATKVPNVNVTAIQRLSLNPDQRPITVATVQGNVLDAAWSPDGSSVAYLTYSDVNQLWLKVAGAAPRALTPPDPAFRARRVAERPDYRPFLP
jgi:hypothetical protein